MNDKKYKNEKEEITEDNKNNNKKGVMNLREKENKNRKEKKRNMQIKESNTKTDSKEKTNNSLLNISKENNTKRSNISKNSKIKTQLKINNEGEIPFQNSNQKSIFTKLSEIMFDNLYKEKSNRRNYYDYESLTNEHFLLNYSKKFNKDNNKTIKNFILRNQTEQRKKKENNIKYMKLEKKNKSNGKLKTGRTISEFLNDQKQFEENKNNDIEKLKNEEMLKTNRLIRNIPLINSNSNRIILEKSRNSKNDKSIYFKLFEEGNFKKQNDEMKKMKTFYSNKKISNKEILNLCEKLFSDSKKRENNNKKARENNYKEITKQNNITSKYSNELLSNKFFNSYKSEISNILNKNVEEDFEINFQDFLLLFFKIGFSINNYSNIENQDNNKEKELKLLKEAWKVLTRNKDFDKEIYIYNHKLIIFLLSILGIYDGNNNNNLLKTKYSFIDMEKNKILPKLTKEIKIFFRIFTNNLLNRFFQREENPLLTEYKENKNKKYSFKPKTNKNKKNKEHLSVEKGYDLYRIKRERSLENERKKKIKEELKECSFFPNNKIHKPSQTISYDVSQRLYNKKPKSYNKENNNTENNLDEDNTFYPSLTTYNSKIFKNDPLKGDKSLSQRYYNYKQSRNDKKINLFLKNKGNKPHKKIEDRENLIKEISDNEVLKTFRFDNEAGNYKNTFDKFNNDLFNSDKKKSRIRYVFEINIDNKVKRLILHKGDNADKQVEKFCYENDLEPDSKVQILEAIKDKFKS